MGVIYSENMRYAVSDFIVEKYGIEKDVSRSEFPHSIVKFAGDAMVSADELEFLILFGSIREDAFNKVCNCMNPDQKIKEQWRRMYVVEDDLYEERKNYRTIEEKKYHPIMLEDEFVYLKEENVVIKHKTVWTFVLWLLILCVFELPIWSRSFINMLENSNLALLTLVNLYCIGSLFALALAKDIIQAIERIRMNR